jgi:hypothetical protein
MRTLSLLPVLLLTACPSKPTDSADVVLDFDGDGYTELEDCDDADAGVHPGADERCNGIDDDCDGYVDDDDPSVVDAYELSLDGDGDGWGSVDNDDFGRFCEHPGEGWLEDASDCDDSDPAIHPEADEYCNGYDDDCDGEIDEAGALDSAWYLDSDGDGYGDDDQVLEQCEQPSGYVLDPGDCDDADPDIHPEADEYCNGIDDDCDEEIDEEGAVDAPSWYADVDGDGYGDPDSSVAACEQPSGYSDDASDCDDGDPDVFPGADEYCNGVDDDCDDDIDEDEAVDVSTWYEDADGDGYGDVDSATTACAAPSDHVADSSDCNDTSGVSYPGADELCDGLDNDCDGEVDEDVVDGATWYLDADGDGYGDAGSSTTTTACEQPSGYVGDDTDCDDADPDINPWVEELCDGDDNDCDGDVDEADAADAPVWYADADGDGYGDPDSTTTACSMPSGHVADSGDCDDADPDTSPEADEHCDGFDNDCDGDVDEDDAVDGDTFYADVDGDGYGDPDSTTTACTEPSGYGTDSSDCDDDAAAIFPGADEHCNGVDDDCDGDVDEDDAVDASTFYADADGDGYGDAGSTTTACSLPSGYAVSPADCDDADPDIYPGSDEYCDGFDNDCDGDVDEDDAVDAPGWYLDGDGDGYGDDSSVTVACSAPSDTVASGGDCDDGNPDINPGEDEVCDGDDNDCDGTVDEDDAVDGATFYADSDGDGYGDAGSTTTACSVPSGYCADSTDCDDGDGAQHPGADERCNGEDDDCDGAVDEDGAVDAPTWYLDADGDGYGDPGTSAVACSAPAGHISDSSDCDDVDPGVYPGADETCDGEDDDCDGDIDEDDAVDAPTWYADSDGDSYGDPGSGSAACSAPSGTVADSGDCDDSDAAIHPGADELCDGVDNDCDGATDEADAVDGSTWYRDGDGDGYGASATTTTSCSQPVGYVADDTDCDDSAPAVHPGADEICNSMDDDCDGDIDEDPVGAPTWYADADGDGFGDPSSSVTDCAQPSGTVSSSTDCDDAAPEVHPFATEHCNGVDDDCDGAIDGGGLATWVASGGAVTDLTGVFAAGTSSTAVTSNLTSSGTLTLCSGTYYVNIQIRGTDIDLVGQAGSGSTFLQGDGSAAVVQAYSTASTLDITGLNISGGYGSAGGGIGGGSHGLALTLDDVVIEDCDSSGNGGGLYLYNGSLSATDLVLDDNYASDYGGGAYLYNAGGSFVGLTVSSNEAGSYGGGMYLRDDVFDISDAVISSNIAYHAGGFIANNCELELVDSEVTGNWADYYGGGLYLTYGTALLEESRIHGNMAMGGSSSYYYGLGGGLFLNNGADVTCEGSSSTTAGVYDNDADYGGGAYLYDGSSVLESDTCDWGYSGGDLGDNDPSDVDMYWGYSGYYYSSFGNNEDFTCSYYSCY